MLLNIVSHIGPEHLAAGAEHIMYGFVLLTIC